MAEYFLDMVDKMVDMYEIQGIPWDNIEKKLILLPVAKMLL